MKTRLRLTVGAIGLGLVYCWGYMIDTFGPEHGGVAMCNLLTGVGAIICAAIPWWDGP